MILLLSLSLGRRCGYSLGPQDAAKCCQCVKEAWGGFVLVPRSRYPGVAAAVRAVQIPAPGHCVEPQR